MEREKQVEINQYLLAKEPPFNVLLVQGARQVGKSTLILNALSSTEHIAINLETNRVVRAQIDKCSSFNEFTLLLKHEFGFNPGDTLYIDEAQESLGLGKFVREMKEVWQKSKVILSGSSMTHLFPEDVRVPVGRISYLQVYPFSFREFLRYQNIENLLDEAISLREKISANLHQKLLELFDLYNKVGGLPEAVKAVSSSSSRRVIQEIFLAQNEDFKRKEKDEPYLFTEALTAIANHVGYPSKLTHVSTNSYQAKKILEKLNHWQLAYEMKVKSTTSTSSMTSKRYLYDTGILNFLRNTPAPDLKILETLSESLRQPLGGIIENAVLLNYLSTQSGPLPELSTWKKNSRVPIEVDFVFEIKSQKIPIEVKACLRHQKRHAKNVTEYLHLTHQKRGMVVCLDQFQKIQNDDFEIFCVPAYFPLTEVFL